MPMRAPSVCSHCGKAHPAGERCAKAAAQDKTRKARFDQKRPSAGKRGYDADWRRESKLFLARNPTCIRCGQPSSMVDHITPHKGDMTLFWNRKNWQPLCRPCHSGWKQSKERNLP